LLLMFGGAMCSRMTILNTTDRRFLPDPQVQKRYGVSAMTLYQWDRDPKLDFPPPLRINGRKFRDLEQLELWERSRVATKLG
jgi:predicted DNA-binding transcriptional regulator AlpA